MAGLLLASHPEPVRKAIKEYRQALDSNPALYAEDNRWSLEHRTRQAAADFLGTDPAQVALTDSTTVGLSQIYTGVRVRSDQELLTTHEDYYATRQAMRYTRRRTGAELVNVPLLPDNGSDPDSDGLVETLMKAVTPRTRVLGVTWVHSKTGLRFPIRHLSAAVREANRNRDESDRLLIVLDAVHGLGVEDFTVESLGCDFFAAGTHKWLFGPRGTGILWGNPDASDHVNVTIPTFTPDGTWGGHMTPGGFKPFEHQWALPAAFRFHRAIGRKRIAERIHGLNTQMKEGLAEMKHIRLHTPMSPELSSGIVCFDVEGMRPEEVVARLLQKNIVASTTPYTPSSARVTPGLWNTPEEVDKTLAAIRSLG